MIATKDDYLRSTVVQDFLQFLRGYVHGNERFHHEYRDRQRGTNWHCDSVFGAYENYSYPLLTQFRQTSISDHNSFTANAEVLNRLSSDLRNAYGESPGKDTEKPAESAEKLLKASCEVFVWGGVAGPKDKKTSNTTGNYLWLEETFPRGQGLREAYEKACSALCSDRPNLSEIGKDGANKVRSNAGFTKIYSLLFDDFIIYDSRVAATLGLFVVKFCRKRKLTSVPDELNFGWMPPKEGKNTKSPKKRDASVANASYDFERANTEAKHAWSNIRANWIFSSVLERSPSESLFATLPNKQDQLRALESAFFMIGYDLGGHEWLSPATEDEAMIPNELVQLNTIAKSEPFQYRADASGYRFLVGKSNSKLFLPESFIQELVTDYSGQELAIGCSRDQPKEGSLGAMLKDKVSATAMASYVAPLLVHLGFATQGASTRTIHILAA